MTLIQSCCLKEKSKNGSSINTCHKQLIGLDPGCLHRIALPPWVHESINFKYIYWILSSWSVKMVSEMYREIPRLLIAKFTWYDTSPFKNPPKNVGRGADQLLKLYYTFNIEFINCIFRFIRPKSTDVYRGVIMEVESNPLARSSWIVFIPALCRFSRIISLAKNPHKMAALSSLTGESKTTILLGSENEI